MSLRRRTNGRLTVIQGKYPFAVKYPIVPASDGSGTVVATGDRVSRFKNGDKVLVTFNQGHLAGPVTPAILQTGVGGVINGTLSQYAVFSEEGLVAMPESLSFKEASTLTCAGVTAWNALYGTEKKVKPGDWVLTQGTGGVSLFALQVSFAVHEKVKSH